MSKMRNIRIEEVSKKSNKIGRGQTLYTNKTNKELLDWFYKETERCFIRIVEL